jgi:phenylpropionate dioxygenase-like ring-hydroxylating dioxygenase large terminal subunit
MSGLQAGVWYAIAAEHDLPKDHVYRTMLGGHELAAWRSTDGGVHVWEDRCPHRGVRFSLGEVVGDELRCQYHAWRFGKTGACTFIPAQPDLKVPRTIHAAVWPVALSAGLVWSGIEPTGAPPELPPGAVLRAIPIARPAASVAHALVKEPLSGLALVLQPLDETATIVRGIALDDDLVRADHALLALRRRLEQAA